MIKSIFVGFQQTFQHKKVITLLYVINLLMALVLAVPFFWTIKKLGGDSMEIAKLLPDFDDTVFSDFMHQAGASRQNYLWQGLWLALFSVVISAFLAGGILEFLKNKNVFSLQEFFGNCGKHFRQFFWLTLVKGVVMLIIGIVYVFLVAGAISTLKGEVNQFMGFGVVSLLMGLLVLLPILATGYAQIALVNDNSLNIKQALSMGWSFTVKRFFKVIFLEIILLAIFALFAWCYWLLENTIGMNQALGILVVILIQQVFIWLKMAWRVWTYAAEIELFIHY